jgi:CRP-like cAMP-binding protein
LKKTSTSKLLEALPEDELDRLRRYLEPVSLKQHQTLYDIGDRLRFVYFPGDCVASRLAVGADGSTVEVGLIGNEGLIGLAACLGARAAHHRTVVEIAGYAARIDVGALRERLCHSLVLRRLITNYGRYFMTQVAQRSVCHRRHTVIQQLCSWLLMVHERAGSKHLSFTQDVIAQRLGARRAGISVAANRLQADGMIFYRRGRITILDKESLEAAACECYSILKTDPGAGLGSGNAAPVLQASA